MQRLRVQRFTAAGLALVAITLFTCRLLVEQQQRCVGRRQFEPQRHAQRERIDIPTRL